MDHPTEGQTRTCPCCGGTAIYSVHTAIVERDGKTFKDTNPGPNSRYAKGWHCTNGTCDFSEAMPMEVPS